MTIIQTIAGCSILPGGGAPLEFIGASHASDYSSAGTLSYPAGIAAGDLLVFVASNLQEGGAHTSPTGGGWGDQGGITSCGIYIQVAAGTESGTVARSAPILGGASIYVFRGAALVDFDAVASPAGAGTAPVPSSVATSAGQLHIIGKTSVESDGTPAGYAAAGTENVASFAIRTHGYLATLASAGSTPTPSLNTSTSFVSVFYSIVIGAA
jgi:hypothetical protein